MVTTDLPVVDISIGRNGTETSVFVNGQNITKHLSGLKVECMSGGLTKATLIVRPGVAKVTVKGILEDVTVLDADETYGQDRAATTDR